MPSADSDHHQVRVCYIGIVELGRDQLGFPTHASKRVRVRPVQLEAAERASPLLLLVLGLPTQASKLCPTRIVPSE